MVSQHLLIIGASARAAAFSALRAGLHPWCSDLFADVDLQQRCTIMRLTEHYPEGFQRFIDSAWPGPWMYTGGLENRPRFVERMARRRPLWGNAGPALSRCRDPQFVAALMQTARMPVPALAKDVGSTSRTGRWLRKPYKSAGGAGIQFGKPGERTREDRDHYFQEFIEGESLSLLFLGDGRSADLLGITRQLVGEPWLRAVPFHYCGSIGLLDPSLVRHPSLEALGRLLASECFLEGLFGVDGILCEGAFFPVEINPRYTASVEVLEHATGTPMLAWNSHVFTHRRLPPVPAVSANRVIGKAILFARADLHFPADGPWIADLRSGRSRSRLVEEMPSFADIPAAGEKIEAGKPILTFFATADSPVTCEDSLRSIASDLDRWLFGR